MLQIALMLPCAAFVGWLIGAWADKHFHQTWIALAGIVFGAVSGLVYVIRMVLTAGAQARPRARIGFRQCGDRKHDGEMNEPVPLIAVFPMMQLK